MNKRVVVLGTVVAVVLAVFAIAQLRANKALEEARDAQVRILEESAEIHARGAEHLRQKAEFYRREAEKTRSEIETLERDAARQP